MKNYNKKSVVFYYDVLTEPYRHFWGDFFHPGIFENSRETLRNALSRTHELLLKDSKLNSSSIAIDLGCGIGSLCFLISKRIGCKVVGANFSKFQLKIARKLAKKYKLGNVEFRDIDVSQIKTPKDTFDAAFLIDVACHFPNKKKALENIFKIIKPGGRLIVMDWLQKDSLNLFEKELLIKPFNKYWNFPYIESFEGYQKLFRKVGFKIVKAYDITNKVKRNWEMFYDIALREVGRMSIRKMITYIKNPLMALNKRKYEKIAENQFYANIFAKICSDARLFKYGYFVLEK